MLTSPTLWNRFLIISLKYFSKYYFIFFYVSILSPNSVHQRPSEMNSSVIISFGILSWFYSLVNWPLDAILPFEKRSIWRFTMDPGVHSACRLSWLWFWVGYVGNFFLVLIYSFIHLLTCQTTSNYKAMDKMNMSHECGFFLCKCLILLYRKQLKLLI